MWYYIEKCNRENFLYDIREIDNGSVQYTHYGPGQYYSWHQDADIDAFYKPTQIPNSGQNLREDMTIIQQTNIECASRKIIIMQKNVAPCLNRTFL